MNLKTLIKNFNSRSSISLWAWLLLLIGIIIRVKLYLFNRSLWLDEASLCVNITEKSFLQLLDQTNYYNAQVAPIGFCYVEKLMTLFFGINEYALRIFPLIAGIVSMFYLYLFIKREANAKVALIALSIFVFADPIIYYTGEVKQYIIDLLVGLLCVYYIPFSNLNKKNIRFYISAGIIGGVVLWFSQPVVFILFSIGLAMFAYIVRDRSFKNIYKMLPMLIIWLISFGINYFFFLKGFQGRADLVDYHNDAFMPLIPASAAKIAFLYKLFFDIYYFELGFFYGKQLAAFFLIGAVIYLFSEKKYKLLFYSLPIIVTYLLSVLRIYPFLDLKIYPFSGRFLIFVVPFFLFYVAYGIYALTEKLNRSNVYILLILFILLASPVTLALKATIKTKNEFNEIKPTLKYVKEHITTNEKIFIYSFADPAFRFYKKIYNLENKTIIMGAGHSKNIAGYGQDSAALYNQGRVWLIFSHFFEVKGFDEEKFLLQKADKIGKCYYKFKFGGASCYLYDFKRDTISNTFN